MRRAYYAVLGVASTAGLREVRQAYRRLARQYSPDVNFWDTQARDLFGEIEEAYRVLSDPAARAMYDRFGHALRDGEALAAGRHGEDVHVTVQLKFADVVRGTNLRLEVVRFSSRSEEHTSELQSLTNLVCRLLLEKKKKKRKTVELQRDQFTKR